MSSTRAEMDETSKAKLQAFNAEQKDWRGVCRVCRTPLIGTLAELLAPCPKCGAEHGK